MSLDQLVSSVFLFQLKLNSLLDHYFFMNFDWLSCAMSLISLASGICYLIFIGSLTVRFDLSDYKLLVTREFWSYDSKIKL